ncbi:heme-binding protein [Agromyces sp. G08B096]|uniref:Heme-binding protein n=1 Tax=Agromyces sp. G08B096 TaxID=3156399 RepID=A0AAU7W6H6_9MICO
MTELTLERAERMTRAARSRAAELGALVSVAVVDAGGHLVSFARMDGAEIAGPTLAVDKAYTAVAQSASTAELAVLAAPGGPLYGLGANGGGRYVIFAGGIPLRADGRIVGAVGVSGGSIEEDEACAQAGVAAFDAG